MPAHEPLLTLTLPPRLDSAGVVRRALARALPADPGADARLADLELLASELVTNAVRHGEPGPITVTIVLAPAHVRIEVTNRGGAFRPPDERDADATGGFGLPLIRRLSRRWGIDTAPGTVTVWLEYAGDQM